MNNSKINTKKLVGIAVFAALAFGVTLVFRIPVSFLTFDAKDAVLVVASFIYGPVAAVLMSLIISILEISISDTAVIGAIMNFVSSAAFAGVASLIYKKKRTFNGALIGLFTSVAVTTGLMMLMNILITPFYMGVDRSVVISMLPTVLLPFNFAKTLMNGAIAMLIYKPVAVALRRAKLVDGKPMDTKFGKQSIITIIVGTLSLAVAITVFIILNA
ncbi:MAG: ECF transporter S component [Clostridia bacterium]|nr:ECF transporter S component [Clostridia bacterium]